MRNKIRVHAYAVLDRTVVRTPSHLSRYNRVHKRNVWRNAEPPMLNVKMVIRTECFPQHAHRRQHLSIIVDAIVATQVQVHVRRSSSATRSPIHVRLDRVVFSVASNIPVNVYPINLAKRKGHVRDN